MFAISFRAQSFHLCRGKQFAIQRAFSKKITWKRKIDLSLMLVTERSSVKSDEEFLSRILQAIDGKITCVQLRDRNEDLRACLTTAYRLKELLSDRNIPLIVNDRVDVAKAVDAEGVHLGQNDLPYLEARSILGPDKIIGWTVDSLDNVYEANKTEDIDYIGAQYEISEISKKYHVKLWKEEGSRVLQRVTNKRVVFIGGIKRVNLSKKVCPLLFPGDGVAVVGDIWRAKNITSAASFFSTRINNHMSLFNDEAAKSPEKYREKLQNQK